MGLWYSNKTNKTELAGIKANGLEVGFGVFWFFFFFFKLCFQQYLQSMLAIPQFPAMYITASETLRKLNQTHNYGCETR